MKQFSAKAMILPFLPIILGVLAASVSVEAKSNNKKAETKTGKPSVRKIASVPSLKDQGAPPKKASKFEYINLSTMLGNWSNMGGGTYGMLKQDPNSFKGEWGFSAFLKTKVAGVEHRVLVDTGKHPHTVIENVLRAGLLKELCSTEAVILTHTHSDHTGGLIKLREYMRDNCAEDSQKKTALSKVYIPREFDPNSPGTTKYQGAEADPIFWDMPFELPPTENLRYAADPKNPDTGHWFNYETDWIEFLMTKAKAAGVEFLPLNGATEVIPGVIATDAIRPQMEGKADYISEEGAASVRDDQSVVVNTEHGLIVISGCGHAGFANTLNFTGHHIEPLKEQNIKAILGGWHLLFMNNSSLKNGTKSRVPEDKESTEKRFKNSVVNLLKTLKIEFFLGSHCTGLDSMYFLRDAVKEKLTTKTAIIDSVGTQFVYDKGAASHFTILPGLLNTSPN